MTLPDVFLDQDTPEKLYAQAGLDADGIVRTALNALGRGSEVVHLAGKLA
jgi:1-deoxy-D-xylulose-5-phosphate synthase